MEKIIGHNSGCILYVDSIRNVLYSAYGPKDKNKYLKCYWRSCTGRAILHENGEVRYTAAHKTHDNHRDEIVRLRFREQIRRSALRNPNEPPKNVFNILKLIHPEADQLVRFSDVRGLIANTRAKHQLCLSSDIPAVKLEKRIDAGLHVKKQRFIIENFYWLMRLRKREGVENRKPSILQSPAKPNSYNIVYFLDVIDFSLLYIHFK